MHHLCGGESSSCTSDKEKRRDALHGHYIQRNAILKFGYCFRVYAYTFDSLVPGSTWVLTYLVCPRCRIRLGDCSGLSPSVSLIVDI